MDIRKSFNQHRFLGRLADGPNAHSPWILSDNKLDSIHSNSFAKNTQLKRLRPVHMLSLLPDETTSAIVLISVYFTLISPGRQIGYNAFGHLEADAFESLPNLRSLRIDGNDLRRIPAQSLAALTRLEVFELDDNYLTQIPLAITKLPDLQELILSDAKELSTFPHLNGTSALEVLRLDRAGLNHVPASLCTFCPKLKSLDIKSNKLEVVPQLNNCREIRVLDLASNLIRSIEAKPFRGMYQMHDLLLANNKIQYIPYDAFYNLSRLQVLDMENNHISFIHPDAFLPISKIEDLIQTLILSYAYHCCAFLPLSPSSPPPIAKDIIVFPDIDDIDLNIWNSSVDIWPSQQNLSKSFGSKFEAIWENIRSDFTYPGNFPSYMEEYISEEDIPVRFPGDSLTSGIAQTTFEHRLVLEQKETTIQILNPEFGYDLFLGGLSKLQAGVDRLLQTQTIAVKKYSTIARYSGEGSAHGATLLLSLNGEGVFNPSSIHIVEQTSSRVHFYWLQENIENVFTIELHYVMEEDISGIYSYAKYTNDKSYAVTLGETRMMGLKRAHLISGFLAVVDASTLGEFRMYAIPWQMSPGCQLAGFLGVLSSELSVYTLAVITLERNYAITHAMHLNKRLSLRHAGYIMVCGWSFAIIMAILPLFSVSDYRKFAVCLPFEIKDVISLTYVVFLMLINGVAFLILMGCYLKMYCAIRGSQAWNSNDSRIAKRMALLVFTDFLCWSPIAFFSLTASFGLQLISLEQAKVFTVFVLPLNSCCNPFLYAILTKQFKKDCVMICKAIEESRVTRGIGRCRHSSNFSNRQTPANTNSLADRSSRENQNHQPPPQCTCNTKLLGEKKQPKPAPRLERQPSTKDWLLGKARWLLCVRRPTRHRRPPSNTYTYQIAEIQQKQHKRASSMSSSENFSSSRSDSWRNNAHNCGIPLRMLDPKRRASSWVVTRKTSQDSNLSSSRNDSSGSATTASTSTWRMSRSTAETSMLEEEAQSSAAVSPAKESNVPEPFYAILHSPISPVTPVRRQSIVTLHPASEVLNNNNDEVLLEKPSRKTDINITNNVLVDEADTGICMKNLTKIDLSVTCNGSHNEASVARPSSTSTSVSIKDVSLTNNGNSSHSGGQAPPEAEQVPINGSSLLSFEDEWNYKVPTNEVPLLNESQRNLLLPFYSFVNFRTSLDDRPRSFSIVALPEDRWLLVNSTDPASELKWLIAELQKAESNSEKVHIIGHIAPGSSDCMKTWSSNFYNIVNRYEHTIKALFYGHSHADEFEVFYEATDFSTFRIYYVDGDHENTTREVLEHETWTFDLDTANLPGNEPNWFKSYSATDEFQLNSLRPNEWNNLIERMIQDDELFHRFYRKVSKEGGLAKPQAALCQIERFLHSPNKWGDLAYQQLHATAFLVQRLLFYVLDDKLGQVATGNVRHEDGDVGIFEHPIKGIFRADVFRPPAGLRHQGGP
ncbi:hypothetical protein HUJ04_009039 [Dendroctonus ponderosae]|nr:hypothetical protein HUJ04_009039 [Dendroctonus ponderosae]